MAMTPDQRWSLSRQALRLLLVRLSSNPDVAAREYNLLRARLVDFFDWRGCLGPETLADETLDRVARKLAEATPIENFRAFVYGVARNISREAERRRVREVAALTDLRTLGAGAVAGDAEARARCLERCLRELPEESRILILAYYRGEGRAHLQERKVLAGLLALSYESLKTRAYRVRERLAACLNRCLNPESGVTNDVSETLSDEGSHRR